METNENQNANTQNNAQSNDWQTVKTGEVVGKPEAEKNYNGIAIASFICAAGSMIRRRRKKRTRVPGLWI